MRISTNQLYDRSIQAVLENQGDLSDLQRQLASGKKLLRPSDDPVGAAQVIRLTEEIDLISQYKKNNNLLTNNLEQEEAVLRNTNDSINRARVLMIQAGNGILDVNDRKAISIEIGQIRDEIFDHMNTRNANGEYIFAGYQSASPAFVLNQSSSGNKYSFQGDEGLNKLQLSDSVTLEMNSSGKHVFENVLSRFTGAISGSAGATSASLRIEQQGAFDKFHKANYDPVSPANNEFQLSIISATQVQVTNVGTGLAVDTIDFSSGLPFAYQGMQFNIEGGVGDTVNFQLDPPEKRNIAETLNNFFLALTDTNISDGNYESAISDALVGIDNGLIALGNSISTIGGRLNVAESVLESNLDLEIANKTARSNIEEVDYAEAVSELSKQETALQAAQATFSRVTGVSLFDFI